MLDTPEEIDEFTLDYMRSCNPQDGHPFSLPAETRNTMSHLLAVTLDVIRDQAKLTNRWCEARQYATHGKLEEGLSHFVDAVMDKTGARCRLAFYCGSVGIDFTLPHMEEIPSMNSEFWSRLSSIVERQNMKFEPNRCDTIGNSKANKAISKFTKAAVFSFLTRFHLAYQHRHSKEASEYGGYSGSGWALDVGTFEKSVYYPDSSWADIIVCFSEILTDFTKLSQELYRSHYIKSSRPTS